jgi:hypothetical protein
MRGVSRVYGLSIVFLVTLIVVAWCSAHAVAATSAPDEITKTWGVKVDATVLRLLDASTTRKLRAAHVTLIVDPALPGTTLRRVTDLARRNRLPVLRPAAAVADCAALAPGKRCAVVASSPSAVSALTKAGDADLVVGPVAGASAFAAPPGLGRVIGVLPLRKRGYKATSWKKTLTRARSATGIDLAVYPTGSGARDALRRLLDQLAPMEGGDRTAPTLPGSLTVTPDGAGGLDASWGAASDKGGIGGYGVYLGGRRVGTAAAPFAHLSTGSCSRQLVQVDAADKAGNRSKRVFAWATPGGCGLPSFALPAVLPAPVPTETATPTPTATATATPTATPTPPETTITDGPGALTNATDATLRFISNMPGATFECKLDTPSVAGAFTACSSPRAYTTAANGAYTFSVRSTFPAGYTDATPATRSFTVDTVAPDTTINGGPNGATKDAAPSFRFSSTEEGVTFECKLDTPSGAGAYAACTSPRTYATTANGAYVFSVRATDGAGNVDVSPASRSFTLDTVAPETTIDSGPAGTINQSSPVFGFSSSEAESTFECRLDGPGAGTGSYVNCTSLRMLGPLADGAYTFSVRAADAAGNTDATPASRSFTVDTTVPDTAVTNGPSGLTSSASPSFAFTSTKSGSTFECKLDGPGAATGTYAACTSPRTYASLADGSYTFSVRATDGPGTVDPTPATRSFTVDTVAPETTITAGASGAINVSTTTIVFSSSEASSTFECRLDGPGGAVGAFSPCTSPRVLGSLSDGSYSFLVRAIDAAGNADATSAVQSFTVDTVAPETTITGGPSGLTGATSASFAFESEAGAAFECRLDTPSGAGVYGACTSSRAYVTTVNGAYTFSVRASDAAGNVDPTPAVRSFTVDTVAPESTITSGPSETTNQTAPTFEFTSSEAESTFECRLDGPSTTTGTFVACASPRTVGPLMPGEYTFSVRATDAAGNTDATPATRSFAVQPVTPETTITFGPSGATNDSSGSFGFSSSPGSTFECKLDGPDTATATYAPCMSPKAYTFPSDGAYTFSVRAIDSLGVPDATPATRSFVVDTQEPTTPTGFEVADSTPTSITLLWQAATDTRGVAGYRVFRDGVLAGTTQDLTLTISSLQCGTSYVLAVEAFDAAGNPSPRATLASATPDCADVTPPTAPGALRASAIGEKTITLSWEASSDDVGVTGYLIYRDGNLYDATSSLSRVLTSLQCGTSYQFGVVARDGADNRSAEAKLTVSTLACSDTTPPTTPTELTVTDTTPTTVTFSWQPSADDVEVTGYRVDRDGTFVELVPSTSYTITGLECQKAYVLGVTARDDANNLSPRATLTVTTAECPDIVSPTQPGNARVTTTTEHTIGLAWDPSTDDRGVTKYSVYRDGRQVASSDTTTAIVPAPGCDTTYELAVAARDKAGNASTPTELTGRTALCASTEPPATLFVAPDGSDTAACTRSAPCAGFNRAYGVSKPGDVVEVAAGTYGPQRFSRVAGHDDGDPVLFRPAAGASVTLAELTFGTGDDATDGPDRITVRGMKLATRDAEPGKGNQTGVFVGGRSSHITLDDIDAGSFTTWKADHVLVSGGDYGPCDVVWPFADTCGNSKIDVSTDVTVDGATFHDYRFDETCFADGADCHYECMYVNAGRNVTVKNSTFRGCAVFDLFVTLSGLDAATMGHRDLTIENNWFATPWTEDPGGGKPTRTSGVALAWCQNAPPVGYQNVRIAFNSFAADTGLEVDETAPCTWEDIDVVGNLMRWNGCQQGEDGTIEAGWAYDYNVWTPGLRNGKCGVTDRMLTPAVLPYVSTTIATPDFHLDGESVIDDLVPASAGCPAADRDGQPRPLAGQRCDAGADER